MKKLAVLLFAVLLIVSIAFAAQWYGPLALKDTWDRKGYGFCPEQSQCLVSSSPSANPEYNGDPSKYFTNPPGPQCINDKQYILDMYCENGDWTSRTKLIALTLLDFADSKSNDFILFCDNYENAVNQYEYLVGSGSDRKLVEDLLKDYRCEQYNSSERTTCVNNICVLKYRGGTAIGTSLNTEINDPDYSFLHAMNHSRTACNNAVGSTAQSFQRCTGWTKSGRAFYNSKINSFIYISTDDTLPAPSYYTAFNSFFKNKFDSMETFVENQVNDPDVSSRNFTFFQDSSLFNKIFYSQQFSKSIFAFLEQDQTEFGYDYLGMQFDGIDLGTSPCENIFQSYNNGRGVYCGSQTGNKFIVVAKGASNSESPLVEAWADLTGKLRPK